MYRLHIITVHTGHTRDGACVVCWQVRDMEPGSAQWIAKPSVTNQGLGIAVIDSCAGLRAALEAQPELREWVVQVPEAPPALSYPASPHQTIDQ